MEITSETINARSIPLKDDQRAFIMRKLVTCYFDWTEDGKTILNSEWEDTKIPFDAASEDFAALTQVLLNSSSSGLSRNYFRGNLFVYSPEGWGQMYSKEENKTWTSGRGQVKKLSTIDIYNLYLTGTKRPNLNEFPMDKFKEELNAFGDHSIDLYFSEDPKKKDLDQKERDRISTDYFHTEKAWAIKLMRDLKNLDFSKATSMLLVVASALPICKYCVVTMNCLVDHLDEIYFGGAKRVYLLVQEWQGPLMVNKWDLTATNTCKTFPLKTANTLSTSLAIGASIESVFEVENEEEILR